MGKKKNLKKPKVSKFIKIDKTKKPKISRFPESPENLTWSFLMLDEDGPFSWHLLSEAREYYKILKRKKAFEGMNSNQIRQTGSHSVLIEKLSKAARDRIDKLKLDDFEELYSLRMNSTNRVWCIKDGNTMRVLWWDPNHEVCPSLKKNT